MSRPVGYRNILAAYRMQYDHSVYVIAQEGTKLALGFIIRIKWYEKIRRRWLG